MTRQEEMLALCNWGMTYYDIGALYGITSAGAYRAINREKVRAYKKRPRPNRPILALPPPEALVRAASAEAKRWQIPTEQVIAEWAPWWNAI